MLFLGIPRKEEKKFYELLLEVQTETIKQISLGRLFSNLDRFARKHLGKYSSYFIHSLGHGIGLDVHELPSLSPENKHKIEDNQVFTIEPGIYFPKKFGLRIEDTVLFNGKAKVLTRSDKKLVKVKF